MTRIVVPIKTPRLYEATRHALNGENPYHLTAAIVGSLCNFATVRCRKVHLQVAGTQIGTGGSDVDMWFFSFHSGPAAAGALGLRIVASADLPKVKFTISVTPDGGSASTLTLASPPTGFWSTSVLRGLIAIDGDTLHTGFITVPAGFYPPASMTVYEVHDSTLSAADTGTVDTRVFHNKAAIHDAQHQLLVEQSDALYRKQGRSLVNMVAVSGSEWTRTSATAVNMIDNTSTSVTSSTPGFNLATDTLAPLHAPTKVKAVLKVYGKRGGGFGSNHVTLRDSSGTVGTVTLPSTIGWVTDSTVELTPGEKYDIYIKSDSVVLATVHSVMLYLWDP